MARHTLIALGFLAVVSTAPLAADAAEPPSSASQRLTLGTYFPEGTLSRAWFMKFAKRATELADGALDVTVRSVSSNAQAFNNAREGDHALAGYYAPALDYESPLFELSALPMVAPSIDEAYELYRIARPYYTKTLAKNGQVLLAAMPWRPAALWSRERVSGPGDLRGRRASLSNRHGMWAPAFGRLGAVAASEDKAEIVLSAGYTGNLDRFGALFKHFAEINYAVQLNFLAVNATAFERLPPGARKALVAAGEEVERSEWSATKDLLLRDHRDMSARGVIVDAAPPAELATALRRAAEPEIELWIQRVGPEGREIIERHRGKR